jgi:hypothetical protein
VKVRFYFLLLRVGTLLCTYALARLTSEENRP